MVAGLSLQLSGALRGFDHLIESKILDDEIDPAYVVLTFT